MAVKPLAYNPSSNVHETKGGSYIYSGQTEQFQEWKFRSSARMKSAKDEDKPKQMSWIIDGLRGEASLVAMKVGIDDLYKPDGFDKLCIEMLKIVCPKASAEATDLYRAGHKRKGELARQHGESMMSYGARKD